MSPVYPVVFLPPALRGEYPHMARRDAAIWERYLKREASAWKGFAYDVALGGQLWDDPDGDPATLKGYQYSSAQRVDVIGDRGEEQWIIEVRNKARISAVGAALGYTMLALREPWTELPLIPCVITDQMSPDVRYVADLLSVEVILVPEDPPRVL